MRKIILFVVIFIIMTVGADKSSAYYYGSQGYSSTWYPGGIGSGLDSPQYTHSYGSSYWNAANDPTCVYHYCSNPGEDEQYKNDQIKYYTEKVTTFCSVTGDQKKCDKYCASLKSYSGKSALCGDVIKKTSPDKNVDANNVSTEKQDSESKKSEDAKKAEEARNAEIAQKENDAKTEVQNMTQEGSDSNVQVTDAINSLNRTGAIRKFFLGVDMSKIDKLKESFRKNKEIIQQLESVSQQEVASNNSEIMNSVQQQIDELNKRNILIENAINDNELKVGFIYWLKGIFRK
ncbi:MAG TPA: hypothetical protein VF817_02455 [Patescibacteria group bacterium]